MKTLILIFTFVLCHAAFSQAPSNPPGAGASGTQLPPVKRVENYREVLAHIPPDLSRNRAAKWTNAQRDYANSALKKALVETKTPAKFRVRVGDVANWKGMTIYSEVRSEEGFNVRIFGKFTDSWKPQLAALKKGDYVDLEGTLVSVKFEDLWDEFSLSITLRECTFTK
jgi:hypothetical protein